MVSRMGMSEQASSTVLDWLHWKSLEVSMKAKIPPTGRERDRQVSQEEKGCFSEITFKDYFWMFGDGHRMYLLRVRKKLFVVLAKA